MPDNVQWQTMVATALVSSFFTACFAEPVKVFIQRYLERRRIRRRLYQEISSNFDWLYARVFLAFESSDARADLGDEFSKAYKRLAYDLALKDVHALYSLDIDEFYWVESLYKDFEHVIKGSFEHDQERLSRAHSTYKLLLHTLKDRHMSTRLMFKVSRPLTRKYFRYQLPRVPYSNEPSSHWEKMLRMVDRAEYWLWGKMPNRIRYPPP